jgi:DNA-binding NtrC family response regulator
MATEFDFIGANDKPALLLINNPEWVNYTKSVLVEMGYKVHSLDTHEEFIQRFFEIQYQVVLVDESFGGSLENPTLKTLQELPMIQRRHAVILLLGGSFETLNAMQAFQQSVHSVVNYAEISLLEQLVQKAVSDNEVFLKAFRETGHHVGQSRVSNLSS